MLLSIGLIIYVIGFSKEMLDLILMIDTLFIPFAFSFVPAAAYITSVGGEYSLRRNEEVYFDDECFTYCQRDVRTGLEDKMFMCKVLYKDIDKIDYNEKTHLLEITGKICCDTFVNSVLKETDECKIFDFLDVYDVEVVKLLKEKMKG